MGSALIVRGADAGVVFSDDFEGDVPSIVSRWGDGISAGISLTSNVPSSSTGRKSLQLNAGLGGSALLYHQLPANYYRLYYRYYVKYEGTVYHHTGAMIGGYDPPTSYPQGDAGLKGIRDNGDRLVVVNFETQSNMLDYYNNWIDMQGAPYQGLYYGRQLLQDLNIPVPNQWTCVELMVTLNTPASASNGELVTWINGTEVANFHPGAPNGYWDGAGDWRMRVGSPAFGGFRWRDTTSLGLNWVKLQNYDATSRVWFDDVVVSTERIGCLPEPALPGSLAAAITLLGALARRRSREVPYGLVDRSRLFGAMDSRARGPRDSSPTCCDVEMRSTLRAQPSRERRSSARVVAL